MNGTPPVLLRALEEADLERTHRWHSDPALYATLGDSFRFVSKTAELEWLRRKASFTSNEVNLAICIGGGTEHIGNIYLREIDWLARKAALHIFIGEKQQRGHGYGREAIQLLLRHAFLDLNLNRVQLEVLADNQPAIKAYAKSGFVVEGTLRRAVFKHGDYKDSVVMSILANDFLNPGR